MTTFGKIFISILVISCQTTPGVFEKNRSDTLVLYHGGDVRSLIPFLNKEDVSENIAIHKRRIRKNPWSVKDYNSLAKLYVAIGQTKKAQEMIKRSLKVDFRLRESQILRAAIAFRLNRDMEAKMLLELLGGERAPEAAVPFYLSGIALRKSDTEEGRRLLQIAIRKDPRFVAAYMNLGLFYLKNFQSDLAYSQFRRVLKIIPEYDDARLHLAILNAMTRKFDKALVIYDELHDKYPNNGLVVINRGVLHLKQGRVEEAFDDLRYYLNSVPKSQVVREPALKLWTGIQSINKQKKVISYTEETKMFEKINRIRSGFRSVSLESGEVVSGFVFTGDGAQPIGI